ncbi:MAG: sortase domain-bontaining protein [Anaerolineaceae bacterium]
MPPSPIAHRTNHLSSVLRQVLFVSLLVTTFLLPPQQIVYADSETSLPAQMNKRFTPDLIPAGGEALLSVNIYNPNFFPLTLSSVPAAWVDILPDGVTFVNPAQTSTTCGGTVVIIGQSLSLVGGTVPAQVGNTPGSCTVTAKVTSVVTGNHDNAIPANNLHATDPTGTISITNTSPATHTLQVDSIASPSLSKSFSPNTQWIGQTSQLSIQIRNNDMDYPLTDTRLTDSLPENVVIANSTVSSSNCGSSVYISGPGGIPLAADQTSFSIYSAAVLPNTTCTVRVNVTSVVPGVYVNTIPANAIRNKQSVTNASAASAPLNYQSIGMSKSFSPTSIQQGGISTLTITLQNPSTSDYTDVDLTDNLPAGLTIAVAPDSLQCGGTITYTNNSITLSDGVIPAKVGTIPGSCTIKALVTSSIPGSFTNTLAAGSLHTAQGATNVTDVTANLGVYGEGVGISGSKSFSPSTIGVNGTSRLTIYITAPTDTDLTNFHISDALPAGVSVAETPNASKNSNCVGGVFAPEAGDTLLSYSGGSIAAGKQCSLIVYVTALEPGRYDNIISPANISNDQDRNVSGNITRTLTVSGISVSKSFYPSMVNINGLSVLTVVLQNVNFTQLENVAFSDTLPSGVVLADDPDPSTTCVDAVLNVPAGGTTFSMSAGKIPAQVGSVPGICTVNVTVRGATTGTKTNRISANGVSGTLHDSGLTITNPSSASADLIVEDLTIGVVKSFDPLTVFGGAASTMTVRLTNPNNAVLTDINFTDNLPQSSDPQNVGGMYIATPSHASTGTCSGEITAVPGETSFSFNGGILAANDSCELTVNVTMDVSGNLINTIPEEAVITSNGAHNTQSASATLTNLAGVSLTKYFTMNPLQEGSGNGSTLAIQIQNTGNVDLTGLAFTDTLPDGITVASPPEANQCGGAVETTTNSITLSEGALAADAQCTILVDVTAPTAGSYENCIEAGVLHTNQETTNADPTCDTLIVEETLLPPSISKDFSPNPVRVNEVSALTFTITNPNNSTMSGVAFSDIFPSGMVRASIPNVSQCGGTVSSTENSIHLENGTITANSSCTVVIAVKVGSAGDYLNTSETVSAVTGGSGNTASDTLQVIAPPTISKTFNPDPITAGATSTLTFTITNPVENTLALEGIAFTDSFPVGLQKASDPIASQCSGTVSSTSSSISLSGASLEAGGSCTVTIDVTVPNAGVYHNTSNAVTSTNGGTGNTASDTLTVNGVGLSLQKSSLSSNFKGVSDIITYSYLLANTGDATLYSPFTVTDDRLSTPFSCGSATELLPGESVSCVANYTITAADVTAKSVVNIATATAKDETEQVVTSNESSVTVKYIGLTLDKTTSTQSYRVVGHTISYSYTLTNTGTLPLYAPFQVTDDHFATPLTCGSVTSLNPGGVVTCSRTYTVTADDVTAGSVTNVAYATAKDAASEGADVISNTDSVTVSKVNAPSIAKEFSPDSIQTGGLSTLTFTITNLNSVSLTGVGFVDNLPTAMEPAYTPQASQCGGTVTYDSANNRITLSNGFIIPESSCTVVVTVTSSIPGDHNNLSNVVQSTNGGNGNTAQDTLYVMSPPVIAKSFTPTSILQSETSTLTLVISNPVANTQIMTGVAFEDIFPAGLYVADGSNVTMVGCGSPAFTPATNDTHLTFGGGTIAVGGSCTITLPVAASTDGIFENTTRPVTSANGGAGVESNTATLIVNAAADLSITKDDGNIAVGRGESLTYILHVVNNGPGDVSGAIVRDTLPSTLENINWTCAAASGASCTASGAGNIEDTVDMVSGASLTYTIQGTVAEDVDTSIVNPATVVPPAGMVDPNLDNNIHTDTDVLNHLQVNKDGVESIFDEIGQILSYNYVVQNTGTSTLLSPFKLNDDLAQITCVYPITLAPLEQFTCTGTYAVTPADLDQGYVTNHASATAKDADGDTVSSNVAEETILADQQTLIGIAKRVVSIEKVSAGTYDVTYEFVIHNYGNVSLQALQITDDLLSTFPDPISFSIRSIKSDDLTVDSSYDGKTITTMLQIGNTIPALESKTLTLVVRVIPPSSGPYVNQAQVEGEHPDVGKVTDLSQNGSNPDPDGDGNPANNSAPTPVNFGNQIFDLPSGKKSYNASRNPIMQWRMLWVNNTNILPINTLVHDPIPEKTTFSPTEVDSGYPVPLDVPNGSTSLGVICKSSKETTTTLCYYEGPTVQHPLGQIIWAGTLAPDYGVTDPEEALNAVEIIFDVLVENNTKRVENIATIDADRNGDGDMEDSGEQSVAQAQSAWEIYLPDTGFIRNRITLLPPQSENMAYTQLQDLRVSIPALELDLPIVGVPRQSDGDWNITWLNKNIGWLQGTAFPTWQGNSVLTAHVYDANGLPGPFANLQTLKWGDRIIISGWGQDYVYEVRSIDNWVDPQDFSIMEEEEFPWLTLITCKGYDEASGSYQWRVVVKAVQVDVQ